MPVSSLPGGSLDARNSSLPGVCHLVSSCHGRDRQLSMWHGIAFISSWSHFVFESPDVKATCRSKGIPVGIQSVSCSFYMIALPHRLLFTIRGNLFAKCQVPRKCWDHVAHIHICIYIIYVVIDVGTPCGFILFPT
jgi:hypothetical protein